MTDLTFRTVDNKIKHVHVKHEVTYTVPPSRSEMLARALAALKSIEYEYPDTYHKARRIRFQAQMKAANARAMLAARHEAGQDGSDTSMAGQCRDAGFDSFGPM